MSTLSEFTLPVKNESTGVITEQTFSVGGASYTELVTTIAAGAETATFTNSIISDSATYDVYTSVYTAVKGMSVSGTTLTVTLKPVSTAMSVKVRIS